MAKDDARGIEDFEKELSHYMKDVERANSEAAKSYLFLEFSRKVFGGINTDYLEKLFPDLERFLTSTKKTIVVKGRIDALLGNLIIEFKKLLDKEAQENAEEELGRYVSLLWNKQGTKKVAYVTIATDGVKFVVYRPRAVNVKEALLPEDVKLDQLDRIDVKKATPRDVFVWLDRYLLIRAPEPVTSESFANEFGLNKPAFLDAAPLLTDSWNKNKEQVIYDQWASLLRIVYGSKIDSEDLFIKHTYLSILAKLLAYSAFSGGALPVSKDQIKEIIEGKIFERLNIYNFLEEDFFSWVGRSESALQAANILIEHLISYDLTTVNEDVLKALYQELVDPQSRHDLGEYYTPDWLAELMVNEVLDNEPKRTVLDPACGSGTFLAATIRKKHDLLKRMQPSEELEAILGSVKGVDVHPLAVILSRVNFLTALGTRLLQSRRGAISIPVYLADSIRLPESALDMVHGKTTFKIEAEGKKLRLPIEIAKDQITTDIIVEAIKENAAAIVESGKADFDCFQGLVSQKLKSIGKEKPDGGDLKILFETSELMAKLIKEKKDTIWAFMLKNIYKPLFLKDLKFDVVIGNPPWLSYRYVESEDYQTFLKEMIITKYKLLDGERAELITQMELATLFLVRSIDLYLAKGGTLAFVMPRSILVSDQHSNLTRGVTSPEVKIMKLFDLENVEPLFKVPSCAVFAKEGTVSYPISTIEFEGSLSTRNSRLAEASKELKQKEKHYKQYRIGSRYFLFSDEFDKLFSSLGGGSRSPYYESFTQGATIVPRAFWFVEPVVHEKLGINPNKPRLRTSERAIERAKEEYANILLEGEVESDFLYLAATGSELTPFVATTLLPVVLPIEPHKEVYRIVTSTEARRKGYLGLSSWLKQVEKIWDEKRKEKANKVNIYSWLNYSNKLTNQSSIKKYKVLYNTSGTNLVACVVENHSTTIKQNNVKIKIAGIIADAKSYWFDTNNLQEALFICAMLNAPIVDTLIKPMQSRGQWGERDIHKKVWELPLPKFSLKNKKHLALVRLAKEAQSKVEKIMPTLETRYEGVGKIRQVVKEEISEELSDIDKIVRELLFEKVNISKSLKDYEKSD